MSGKLHISVICSFDTSEQVFIEIEPSPEITMDQFLKEMFKTLTNEELAELVKFSCCQNTQSKNEKILPFLLETNGKFYFNPDVNNDQETIKCDQLRNDYLSNR